MQQQLTNHNIETKTWTHCSARTPLGNQSLHSEIMQTNISFTFFKAFTSPEKIWGGSIVHLCEKTARTFAWTSHTAHHYSVFSRVHRAQFDTSAHDQYELLFNSRALNVFHWLSRISLHELFRLSTVPQFGLWDCPCDMPFVFLQSPTGIKCVCLLLKCRFAWNQVEAKVD